MLFHNFRKNLQKLPVLKTTNPLLCALFNKKIVLKIVSSRGYSSQVMHYRLNVSAEVLLPRFLFYAKKAQENFKIFESRDSTGQKTLPTKKLDDLKMHNKKTALQFL